MKNITESQDKQNIESMHALFVICTCVTWECTRFQPIRRMYFFIIIIRTHYSDLKLPKRDENIWDRDQEILVKNIPTPDLP